MVINKRFRTNILMCFLINILFACESKDQKTDEAFERVKEKKMFSANNDMNNNSVTMAEPKPKLDQKIDTRDEWTRFNTEIENKILANEKQIKEIKCFPSTNGKLFRKIVYIEKDNNDLRNQMAKYNEETKENWKNFKVKISQNVSDINRELKDISIDSKNELTKK